MAARQPEARAHEFPQAPSPHVLFNASTGSLLAARPAQRRVHVSAAGCDNAAVTTLIDQLDYHAAPANGAQRFVWKITGSRPGAWLFARVAQHLDRGLLRLTDGRVTAPGFFAGLPTLFVTMRGARTGATRTVPLVGIPSDGDIALIGTRFGQHGTPAWYFNLVKTPEVELEYKGRHARALAREVDGARKDRIWDDACRVYAGYAAYARRIKDRPIHVMVLSTPPTD